MRISSLERLKRLVGTSLVGSLRLRQLTATGATTLGLAGVLIGAFPSPCPAAYPPSAEGRTYAASTDHAEATRAAIDVLASGGNAADGAVAAALALGVVNPSASGIGGGGFALVWSAKDKKVTVLDFRERAPATYSADVLWPKKVQSATGKGKPSPAFTVRGGVVGVPGEPAGLELLNRRFGRRALAEDAAPAVALAQNGFYAGKHLAEMVASSQDRVQAAPGLAADLLSGGNPIQFASRVRRPALAATLARFGVEGKRALYEGVTARKIVDAVKGAGGTLSMEDLASYEVKERAPLSKKIDARTIYTMPAPSAGGLMLLETLGMYGASPSSPLAAMGFGSSAYLHTVAEAMRGAYADRVRFAGDPDLEKGADAAFAAALEPAQLAARRARISPTTTHAPQDFKTKERGTTHLVVADGDGNIVAMTTTVNGSFGSSIVPEGTGIVLNDELEDFSAPDEIQGYGLRDGGPNRPRPLARPVSSMTPTIVIEDDRPILALGGSGGTRIATAVTQAALARLVFDLDPNACVSHPRVHVQGTELLVDREIASDVRDGLRARGETVKDEQFLSSAVQLVAIQRKAGEPLRFLAASDPRKAGLSAAR